MSKLRGPLLYDSLDRDNPKPTQVNAEERPKQNTSIVIVSISTLAMLVGFFYIWLIRTLEYKATIEFSQWAAIALYSIYGVGVFALCALFIGGVFFLFTYLHRVVKLKGVLSLHEGPFIDVTKLLTDRQLEQFAARMYTVMEERAKHSQYQGVSTLTLDKSSTNTVKEDKVNKPPQETQEEELKKLPVVGDLFEG